MARTKQTSHAQRMAEQKKNHTGGKKTGKGKKPRKTPTKAPTAGGVKKPRAPRDPNKPPKPAVAYVVTDADVPQYTSNLTKLWKHLKANPDAEMLDAAAKAWEGTGHVPTRKALLDRIAKVRISAQFMNTLNEYQVEHMSEVCKVLRSWYGKSCAGKTLNVARYYASLPYLYLRPKQRFEAEAFMAQSIAKYEKSFEG